MLTADKYYSADANRAFMSASQIKSFMRCPAATMAELRGEYTRPATSALMIGSYVDAHFEGTLDELRTEHPELYKRDGTPKAEYQHADTMIARAESDKVFMEFMRGDKQRIITGDIDGVPFKAKMDVYLPGERIVDLKTVRDFEPKYKPGSGLVSFVEYWGYDLQMAIYQMLEGNKLPTYIAAITKEPTPDIAAISIPQHYMDAALAVMRENLQYYDAIKNGLIEPPRCGHCEYCKSTKVLTGAQPIEDFEINEEDEII